MSETNQSGSRGQNGIPSSSDDPEIQEHIRQKAARRQKWFERLSEVEQPILLELAAIGFPANELSEVPRLYAPLSRDVIEVLLRNLPLCPEDAVKEWLVRCLAATKLPYDGSGLVNCYKTTSDECLKFAVLNTIASSNPHSIGDWLKQARNDDFLRKKLTDLGYRWPRSTETK
jgi:hypothetical protein